MSSVKRGVRPDDLYRLRFPHSLALSPDGRFVACAVMQPDEATNQNCYSLLVITTSSESGAKPRVVSEGEPGDPRPSWSPDSTRLAWVTDRDGAAAIRLLEMSQDDQRILAAGRYQSISRPHWSPDGSCLATLVMPRSSAGSVDDDPSADPRYITGSRYKFDGAGWFGPHRRQLAIVPIDGSAPRQLEIAPALLTDPILTAERGVPLGEPAWSHDGARIAFPGTTIEDEARAGRCDIWTIDIEIGRLTRVTPNDGLYGCPAWSPDDRALAYVGAKLPKQGGANAVLWSSSSVGGALNQITLADICVGSSLMSDTGASSRAQPVWVGDTIYFSAGQAGSAQLWRVAAQGGKPEPVTVGRQAVSSWELGEWGSSLAFIASNPTNPGDVYWQRLDQPAGAVRRLTHLNDELLASVELSQPEAFSTTVPDGSETVVQGWIMRPVNAAPDRPAPAVLEIHGGPHVAYGYSWFHEFQVLTGAGYAVVYGNPRGSSGYGEAFATSIYLDWGTKPTADVLALLDHAIAADDLGSERLFVTGGSYGGYLVDWIVTHTDRFRAAVAGRCVSDLRTLALASDNGTLWMAEYFGGLPWEAPDVYAFGSPISHVANCSTPLLIEHQANDMRCTMDQAEQMYNALTALGVETELVIYPNESHGMSRNGQPRHRVDRLLRTLDWFQRHDVSV